MDADTVVSSHTCECESEISTEEYKNYEALVCADCGTPVVVLWGTESRLQSKAPAVSNQF